MAAVNPWIFTFQQMATLFLICPLSGTATKFPQVWESKWVGESGKDIIEFSGTSEIHRSLVWDEDLQTTKSELKNQWILHSLETSGNSTDEYYYVRQPFGYNKGRECVKVRLESEHQMLHYGSSPVLVFCHFYNGSDDSVIACGLNISGSDDFEFLLHTPSNESSNESSSESAPTSVLEVRSPPALGAEDTPSYLLLVARGDRNRKREGSAYITSPSLGYVGNICVEVAYYFLVEPQQPFQDTWLRINLVEDGIVNTVSEEVNCKRSPWDHWKIFKTDVTVKDPGSKIQLEVYRSIRLESLVDLGGDTAIDRFLITEGTCTSTLLISHPVETEELFDCSFGPLDSSGASKCHMSSGRPTPTLPSSPMVWDVQGGNQSLIRGPSSGYAGTEFYLGSYIPPNITGHHSRGIKNRRIGVGYTGLACIQWAYYMDKPASLRMYSIDKDGALRYKREHWKQKGPKESDWMLANQEVWFNGEGSEIAWEGTSSRVAKIYIDEIQIVTSDCTNKKWIQDASSVENCKRQQYRKPSILVKYISHCLLSPCLNAGTCVDGYTTRTCVCTTGYGGEDCSKEPLSGGDPNTQPNKLSQSVAVVLGFGASFVLLIIGMVVAVVLTKRIQKEDDTKRLKQSED